MRDSVSGFRLKTCFFNCSEYLKYRSPFEPFWHFRYTNMLPTEYNCQTWKVWARKQFLKNKHSAHFHVVKSTMSTNLILSPSKLSLLMLHINGSNIAAWTYHNIRVLHHLLSDSVISFSNPAVNQASMTTPPSCSVYSGHMTNIHNHNVHRLRDHPTSSGSHVYIDMLTTGGWSHSPAFQSRVCRCARLICMGKRFVNGW